MSNDIKKYDYLDHLRWIAIIWVILTHLHYLSIPSRNWLFLDTIFKIWGMWVPLFFLISAYALALSTQAREKTEAKHWYSFYIRRFFRIYPLFFIMVLVVYFLFSSMNWMIWNINFDTSAANLFSHIFFLFGFSPKYIWSMYLWEWSLFNEFIFYLLFPLIYSFFKKTNLNRSLLMTVILWFFSYLANIIANMHGGVDLYGTPITHMFSFWVWMLVFKLTQTNLQILLKHSKILRLLNIVLYIILTTVYIYFGYLHVFIYFIINLWLTLFLFAKWIYKIPKYFWIHRFLKFTGLVSYSLYLINYRFYLLMWTLYALYLKSFIHLFIYDLLYILLVLAILYSLSYLTYLYIEQPWIEKGKALIKKYF